MSNPLKRGSQLARDSAFSNSGAGESDDGVIPEDDHHDSSLTSRVRMRGPVWNTAAPSHHDDATEDSAWNVSFSDGTLADDSLIESSGNWQQFHTSYFQARDKREEDANAAASQDERSANLESTHYTLENETCFEPRNGQDYLDEQSKDLESNRDGGSSHGFAEIVPETIPANSNDTSPLQVVSSGASLHCEPDVGKRDFAQASWIQFPPCVAFLPGEPLGTDQEAVSAETDSKLLEKDVLQKQEWEPFDTTVFPVCETGSLESPTDSIDGVSSVPSVLMGSTSEMERSPGAVPVDGPAGLAHHGHVEEEQDIDAVPSPELPPTVQDEADVFNVTTAHVVNEQLLYAIPMNDAETNDEANKCSHLVHRPWFWRVTAAIVVTVITAIVLGVVLGLSGDNKQSATQPPTAVPTVPPTVADNSLLTLLLDRSFDNGTSLANSSTPQAKAYEWLRNDAASQNYRDDQVLQRFALATFYFSSGGTNWTQSSAQSSDWLSGFHECTWFSPEPLCRNGQNVDRLFFEKFGLVGRIPADIALLSNSLEIINFQENQLTGSIPKEFGHLTKLSTCTVFDNHLTSTIPSEIGGMENLETFILSTNKLDGSLPTEMGRLSSVVLIHLGNNNNLDGSIPTELGLLQNIEVINFNDNSFNGSIPTSLFGLRSLERLNLSGNKLVSTIPSEIGQLEKLEKLHLGNNGIEGSIPSEIGLLSKLEELQLYTLMLSGSLPYEIFRLTSMELLWLQKNKLTGSVPSEIGILAALESIHLQDNRLSGTLPLEIKGLAALTSLHLEINRFTGTIPSEIHELEGLTGLYLYSNNFTPPWTCPSRIEKCFVSCLGDEPSCREL